MWTSHKYTYIPAVLNLPLNPSPHPTPLGHHRVEFPVLHSNFPLAVYFPRGHVCTSTLLSQLIPPSPSPAMSTHLFSTSVSMPALQMGSLVPFFQIPYICINIWYLLLFFWLTSLCITALGSSTSAQQTQNCSFFLS